MERALRGIEPAFAVQARGESPQAGLERRGDEIERRRVPGLVGAHPGNLGSGEIPSRRPAERHDLQNARVGLQHRAQRHAHGLLPRLVEALLSPADLDKSPFGEDEPRQPLHQVGALDHDPRMPAVADHVQRPLPGARVLDG